MHLILLLVCLGTTIICSSQTRNENVYLEFSDTYVLKIKPIEDLTNWDCKCSFRKGTGSRLFKIKISDVLHCPDNGFADSAKLLVMEYIVVTKELGSSLKKDQEITVTAMPSDSKYYLAMSRILPDINTPSFFIHKYGFISGLIDCNKNTKRFEKIILGKNK